MNPTFLLIIVVMFGAMFMMTRSAKKKQAQASEMRNKMEPGSGIRTIGGMYALVKAVNDDSVELEVAPGVHAIYAKNAIAVVMDGAEYNRIVHGDEPEEEVSEFDVEADAAPVVASAEDTKPAVGFDKAEAPEAAPAPKGTSAPETAAVLDKSAGPVADKPVATTAADAGAKAEDAVPEPAADNGVAAK